MPRASSRAAANLLSLFLRLRGGGRGVPTAQLLLCGLPLYQRSSPVKIDVRYPSLSYRPSHLVSSRRTPGLEIDQSWSRSTTAACHRDPFFFCRKTQ